MRKPGRQVSETRPTLKNKTSSTRPRPPENIKPFTPTTPTAKPARNAQEAASKFFEEHNSIPNDGPEGLTGKRRRK